MAAERPGPEKKARKEPSSKNFMRLVESKVRKTILKHGLFKRSDRIAVACSGGKDSTVCLYILKKLRYDVEAVTVDAAIGSYTRQNLENLKSVCKKHGIRLHVLGFREEFGMSLCFIRDLLKEKGLCYSSCKLCGILKRYLLNRYCREGGFSCLATGHNLDDEAQTFVMNVFRNDFRLAERQGPKPGILRSKGFVGRVKPLYNVTEAEIVRYSRIMRFPVYYGICPCSVGSFRRQFREFLDSFEKMHPSVKHNILRFQETMRSRLKKEAGQKIGACSSCGEPASREVCNACRIFVELRKESGKKHPSDH